MFIDAIPLLTNMCTAAIVPCIFRGGGRTCTPRGGFGASVADGLRMEVASVGVDEVHYGLEGEFVAVEPQSGDRGSGDGTDDAVPAE